MTTGTNGWTVFAVAIVVSTLLGCAGSSGTSPPTPVTVAESGGSTDVTEGGATDTYTVVLDSQPTADVMIAVSTDAEVSVATSSLTFTSVDWNVAQTVNHDGKTPLDIRPDLGELVKRVEPEKSGKKQIAQPKAATP